MPRDFLGSTQSMPVTGELGSSTSEANGLLLLHADYLADIAQYLRQGQADVLTSPVVRGANQVSSAITDTNDHEVMFEVGGKPVEIYRLFIFNTYDNPVTFSFTQIANIKDGLPIASGAGSFEAQVATHSIHIMCGTIAGNSLIVNGPNDATHGGIIIAGFTIPDYDRIRGSIRS